MPNALAHRRPTTTSTDPLSMMVATAHALRRCTGEPSKVARLAGLSRQSLDRTLRLMEHHGFARNDNGRWRLILDTEAA
jgi:DNA-binding IclR family transcriptional regulator